jgi:hypothetical protein
VLESLAKNPEHRPSAKALSAALLALAADLPDDMPRIANSSNDAPIGIQPTVASEVENQAPDSSADIKTPPTVDLASTLIVTRGDPQKE